MRIAILGGTGNVGRRALAEAHDRGHRITMLVRDSSRTNGLPDGVETVVGDASDPDMVRSVVADHDAVIAALRPPHGRDAELVGLTEVLVEAVRNSDPRLLVVGGAATLRVPGTDTLVMDEPRYLSPDYRGIALACAEQLRILRQTEEAVDWTYLSPAANLHPGQRTGRYRVGADLLVVDDDGDSAISMEDLAVAVLDELERPEHRRRRFTVAY